MEKHHDNVLTLRSHCFFGKRVTENIKQEIKSTFVIDNEGEMRTYLRIQEDILS